MSAGIVFWSLIPWTLFAALPQGSPPHGRPHPRHAEVLGTTALDVYRDQGVLHLLLEEEAAGEPPRLLYRASRDGGRSFSSPIDVPTDVPPVPGHRGGDPQIAAFGKEIVCVWTGRGSGYMGRGKMGVARSTDGGKTWQSGKNPADDGDAEGGHAFLDLAFDTGGRCHLVWLDERNGRMGLRAAFSDDAGMHWSANRTIDPDSCTCCPNALLTEGQTLFVLYRMARPRDTALAVSLDRGERWKSLGPVGDFHWEFLGCPHWGSGIASLGSGQEKTLCTAVQTGKQDRAGLYFLKSSDGGNTWTPPARLAAQGRFVDLAAAAGTLCAVWEDSAGSTSRIVAVRSVDGGKSWSAPQPLSQERVWATHPRVVGTQDGFLILWTEAPDPLHSRWNSARLDLR